MIHLFTIPWIDVRVPTNNHSSLYFIFYDVLSDPYLQKGNSSWGKNCFPATFLSTFRFCDNCDLLLECHQLFSLDTLAPPWKEYGLRLYMRSLTYSHETALNHKQSRRLSPSQIRQRIFYQIVGSQGTT